MIRRLTWCCLLLLLACVRCAEIEGPRADPGRSLEGLIVSESQPAAAASGSIESAAQISVTYVSLRSGTLPLASSVQIRNRTTGTVSGQIPMIDGGFDPIAIEANVGDWLDLTVTLTNGNVETFSARVPPRRPPTIVRTNPPMGRTDVALSIRPTVIFSEPIDPTTITTSSVRLLRGGAAVPGTVGLQSGSTWATEFAPASPLEPGTSYDLVVTQEIRGLDGDPLDAAVTSAFTTIAGTTADSGTVTGSLTIGGKPPITGYFVSIERSTPPSPAVNRYDRFNRNFVFSGLPSGEYQVTAIVNSYGHRSGKCESRVNVTGGQTAIVNLICTIADGGIYIANADGSDARRITRGNSPAWSPDGQRIMFDRDMTIYGINADGSNEIALGRGVHPAWSPDGQRVAFADGLNISVMNADGSNVRQLFPPNWRVWQLGLGMPSWSPDGRYIAIEDANPDLGDDFAYYRIRIVNADVFPASEYSVVGTDSRDESAPAWSPDGSVLSGFGSTGGTGFGGAITTELITIGAFNGPVISVIHVADSGADGPPARFVDRPAWSPAGDSIAFTAETMGSSPWSTSIYKIERSGGTPRLLISNARAPAWSPDGSRIAFVRNDE